MSDDPILARCESCSKSYRVPDAGRTFRCKTCGGALTVATPPAAPALDLGAARECPQCHALNFEAAAHCGECGAAMTGAAPGRSHAERVARFEASSELSRAGKLLKLLRALYFGALAFNVLGIAGGSLALLAPDIPPGPAFLVVGMFAFSAALNLAGAMLIVHQPLLWSLLNAGLTTLSAAMRLHEAYSEDTHGVAVTVVAGLSIAWVLLMWWIVFAAAKVQRLRRRHPDLYAAHLLTNTLVPRARASSTTESGAERAARIQEHARRRAVRSALVAASVVLALSVLVSGGVYAGLRPAPLSEASARFCEAWNGKDVDAIAELCVNSEQDLVRRKLRRLVEVRQWLRAWPTIRVVEGGEGEVGAVGGAAHYELSNEEEVVVRWRLATAAWKIEGLTLPGPSVQPRVEEFVSAWRSGELSRMLALYPEFVREERTRGVERLLERLGWPGSKSSIAVRRAHASRPDRVEVTFEVDSGRTLDARFELDDDFVWWVDGLRSASR